MKRLTSVLAACTLIAAASTANANPDESSEIAEFLQLEAASYRPVILGVGSFDASVLGTSVGARGGAGAERSDAAAKRSRLIGSQVLRDPKIRARFDDTSMFGLNVHDEPSVRKYLDFFDGRGKPILVKWLARMGRYRALIEQVLEEEGLPQDLIYVAMIESGFSPYATSPAAAVGVWQFIRTTGSEMGLRIDAYVDERRDPVRATRAAARYLARLNDKFGSWPLALAAYNGGPGLIAKEVSRHNSNNYWRIQRSRGMYEETRRYVPKIIAAGLVHKNADVFGLGFVKEEPAKRWTEVIVPGGTRLSLVADAAGIGDDELRFLNPALVRRQTPPGEEWKVRIPRASLDRFVSKFDKYVADRGAEHITHAVAFGESLEDIGRKYGVMPRVLRVANGLQRRERASAGEELLVPSAAMGSWKPAAKKQRSVILENAALTIPGTKKYFYEVNVGDTLDALAQGFHLNPADVVIWNGLDPTARLQPGMVLQVFLPQDHEPTTLALLDTNAVRAVTPDSVVAKKIKQAKRAKRRRTHKVKAGESLWLIANRYKVTVEELKKWNRKTIGRKNILQPGMKLVVSR